MSSVPMPGTEGLAHHQLDQAEGRQAIPFTGQLTNIAPYIAAAARHVCPDDVDAEEVARLAVERFSSIGALEHGDAMFHLTPEQLLDEEVAEYADAIIYRARRMAIAALRELATRGCDICDASHPADDPSCAVTIRLTPIQPPALDEIPGYALDSSKVDAIVREAVLRSARRLAARHRLFDQTTGYDEDNRAEALHPQQGDA